MLKNTTFLHAQLVTLLREYCVNLDKMFAHAVPSMHSVNACMHVCIYYVLRNSYAIEPPIGQTALTTNKLSLSVTIAAN